MLNDLIASLPPLRDKEEMLAVLQREEYGMGKFVVKETNTGFKFDLKATNGQVIATSEVYTTKAACLKGIESVKKNCVGGVEDQTVENYETVKHPKFEVYADKAGEFRFRLKATNGEVIAVSEGQCMILMDQGKVTEIGEGYITIGEGMEAVQASVADGILPETVETGAIVRVIYDGQMTRSIPAQITAGEVVQISR